MALAVFYSQSPNQKLLCLPLLTRTSEIPGAETLSAQAPFPANSFPSAATTQIYSSAVINLGPILELLGHFAIGQKLVLMSFIIPSYSMGLFHKKIGAALSNIQTWARHGFTGRASNPGQEGLSLVLCSRTAIKELF